MRFGPKKLLCVLLVALCACANPNKVPQWQMTDQMQYHGFSVDRPPTGDWYLFLYEHETTQAVFRVSGESEEHTIYTGVQVFDWPSEVASSDDLVAYMKARGEYTEGASVISFEIVEVAEWSVSYEQEAQLDDEERSPLILHTRARIMRHPALQDLAVLTVASERGPQSELYGDRWLEAQYIFDAVVLESAPGVPVAINR